MDASAERPTFDRRADAEEFAADRSYEDEEVPPSLAEWIASSHRRAWFSSLLGKSGLFAAAAIAMPISGTLIAT